MFKKIVKSFSLDKDYSERSILLDMYTRFLNNEFYDLLPYSFSDEYDITGKYIPLHRRQPSVTYNLCKVVVDDSVSLLFGENHFPQVMCDDQILIKQLNDIVREAYIEKVMIDAATSGSVGSVVLFVRIFEGKIFVEVKSTQYLTPQFDPNNPFKLIKLTEKYKVKGKDLKALGYDNIDKDNQYYWFQREWDENSEIFYLPFKANQEPQVDNQKTFQHQLGLVPAIWIKNLPKPGCKGIDEIDGQCTFKPALDANIEIDYLLSQGGRALKYSADPLIVFKMEDDFALSSQATAIAGDISGTKKITRTASNAFVLGPNDDSKLLEINGKACEATIAHVTKLRELALESIHGNRANADKVNAAQSGSAQKEMNQALIWLADKLRISYGNCGLLLLFKMIIEISHKKPLLVNGEIVKNMNQKSVLSLKWPHWYPPTPSDRLQTANSLKVLADSKHISQKTAVQFISDDYSILNIENEIIEIAKDQEKINALGPQVTERIEI